MFQNVAWFYWDPNPIIFTLPYVDRPLAWYGLLFVTGFFFGFLIIVPMIQRRLRESPICRRDIASWHHVIRQMQQNSHLTGMMEEQARVELAQMQGMQEPSPWLKKMILETLNHADISRSELEKQFPKGLASTYHQSVHLADRLTWYVVGGTLIGARLGHVFFYGWSYYRHNLWDIFKIWEGGLASHGGAVGVILALFLFSRSIRHNYPEFSLIPLMDTLAVPTAIAAFFIRLGNFVNQEIIGVPTTVSWAVVFGHPYGGQESVPRHPAQLYEGLCYLATFALLYTLWRRKANTQPGTLVGLFLVLVFTSRFLIEFFKVPQSLVIDESLLLTGQILSLPFIILGLSIYFFPNIYRYSN